MVKTLSSYINFTVALYIIEPLKIVKKWAKNSMKMKTIVDSEYIYSRDINIFNEYHLCKTDTIMSKVILKHRPDKIDWSILSRNSSRWVYKLLKNNTNKIDYNALSQNKSNWTIKILDLEKINWHLISANPSRWACKLIKNNPDKIELQFLLENPSKWAIRTLEKYNNIDLKYLSHNPCNKIAYELLVNNPTYINYHWLCVNSSKWINKILNKNLDKINWHLLLLNSSKWAYKLLKKNPEKIIWAWFSANPYILNPVKINTYYKLFDNILHKKKL